MYDDAEYKKEMSRPYWLGNVIYNELTLPIAYENGEGVRRFAVRARKGDRRDGSEAEKDLFGGRGLRGGQGEKATDDPRRVVDRTAFRTGGNGRESARRLRTFRNARQRQQIHGMGFGRRTFRIYGKQPFLRAISLRHLCVRPGGASGRRLQRLRRDRVYVSSRQAGSGKRRQRGVYRRQHHRRQLVHGRQSARRTEYSLLRQTGKNRDRAGLRGKRHVYQLGEGRYDQRLAFDERGEHFLSAGEGRQARSLALSPTA